jgi:hypothetical protein
MTPGWSNVRNGLAASYRRRPRGFASLDLRVALIVAAAFIAGWALLRIGL